MRLSALSLFILLLGLESTTALDARSTLVRATERVHKFALRHSAGLARDLRLILRNLDQQPLSKSSAVQGNHRVYCTRPNPFDANATSPASPGGGVDGGNSNNGGGTGTATGRGPRPTGSSPFKLVEEHVSDCSLIRLFTFVADRVDSSCSRVRISLMGGTSSLLLIRQMVRKRYPQSAFK